MYSSSVNQFDLYLYLGFYSSLPCDTEIHTSYPFDFEALYCRIMNVVDCLIESRFPEDEQDDSGSC